MFGLIFSIVVVDKLLEKFVKLMFELLILLSLEEFIDFDFWLCLFVFKLISFWLRGLGEIGGEEVDEDCFCR